MGVIMRVGTRFAELEGVWPYLLEEQFGEACVRSRGRWSLLGTKRGRESLPTNHTNEMNP